MYPCTAEILAVICRIFKFGVLERSPLSAGADDFKPLCSGSGRAAEFLGWLSGFERAEAERDLVPAPQAMFGTGAGKGDGDIGGPGRVASRAVSVPGVRIPQVQRKLPTG